MKTKEKIQSSYKGSSITYELVERQIIERWGEEEAENYDPYENTMTLRQWNRLGYRVKKGEKAIRSFTIIKNENEETGEKKHYKKNVYLFYIKQVEKA